MNATEHRNFLNLFAKHEFQKIAQKVFLMKTAFVSPLASQTHPHHMPFMAWGPICTSVRLGDEYESNE